MTQLPEELLESIFSLLHQPRVSCAADDATCRHEINTLLDICQASKAFNRIACPFLYRTLTPLAHSRHDTLKCLLETFASKPGLANHVVEIQYGRLPDDASSASAALDMTTAEQLMNRLDARNMELPLPGWRDKLFRGVLDGVCDAQMAILLALCPNLEVVTFNAPHHLHPFAVKTPGFELEMLLCVLGAFWSRHRGHSNVIANPVSTSSLLKTNRSNRSMSSTNLRRISVWRHHRYGFGQLHEISRLPTRGAIQIQAKSHDIALEAAVVDGEALEQQLISWPALTGLNLVWNIENWRDAQGAAANYDNIPKLLELYGRNLQSLVIWTIEIRPAGPEGRFRHNHMIDFCRPLPPLRSLRLFGALRTLTVPLELLTGSRQFDGPDKLVRLRDVLPFSLGFLYLGPMDRDALMSAHGFHQQLAELVDDVRFVELEGICLTSRDQTPVNHRALPLMFPGWRQHPLGSAIVYRKEV
ncbi:hypothetical protein EJ03DRAFT_347724 [Teratosphaeria nubilosa]|uniref:Uncharacterized protein n=1 Tax=Teratosphaeria nubilosa TaxID=161662 RepID=A0A6G1LMB2_9PEZI|nr:hypothetical protein EJ03DRAFT_347724 [Teratosphaeria nubilosa]